MKNWLYFPMIIMLLASCKNEKTAPEPEPVVLDPVLTLAVSKNTVTTGDTLTVFCKTENAVKTENNIGAPTTPTWKYTFKITETKKIIVSPMNKLGKTVTSDKDVTAVAYVPTMIDTLKSSSWFLEKYEQEDPSGNIIKYLILSDEEKKEEHSFLDGFVYRCKTAQKTLVGEWGYKDGVFSIGSTKYFYIKIIDNKKLIIKKYVVADAQGTVQIWKESYWRP